MKNRLLVFIIFSLSGCQVGLTSSYTGGVTQDTLIKTTWQEINTDFDGTYLIWEFMSNSELINIQRGVSLKYTWTPYTEITGTVSPNPQNQGVFELSSSVPGEILKQYMLVWIIDEAGTKAVIEVFTTPEDIVRYLVNEKHVYQVNYQKITP